MKRLLVCALCVTLLVLSCLYGCDYDKVQETKTQTETETATATETEPVTETDTEPATEAATETATETATDADTDADVETEVETMTEVETETETEPATETDPETEPETTPIAGTDSGIVRDGTPKKYFTLAFDDGITQDKQIVELLRKYEVDCCTFYVNTGLLGAEWTWVGTVIGHPEVSHLRFTKEELQSGIYDGFDMEVHTLSHPSLSTLTKRQVQREVSQDAKNITKIFGVQPVGMAWPGGDGQYTAENVLDILDKTDIRFARGTTSTNSFALPQYFMTWYPTTSIVSANVLTLAQQFLAADCTEDMLFYVWGHGYELDAYNKWGTLESLIAMMSEASRNGEVVLVTQAEFYQLFKDEIPSWGDDASVK